MGYAFFLSYATADKVNGGSAMPWFFDTLERELKIVHGAMNVQQGGFMAMHGIHAGEDWRRKALPEALNTSAVLVCLYSENYFDSVYCGRELEVFLQRRRLFFEESNGASPPDCILPIMWVPPATGMPATLPTIQWSQTPGLAKGRSLYEACRGRSRGAENYISSIAKRISNLLLKNTGGNALPALPQVDLLETIQSAFAFPELPLPEFESVKSYGPTSVTLVYPALKDVEWPFAPPAQNAAVLRAAVIAKQYELSVQGISFASQSPDLPTLQERLDRARRGNTPIIGILTPETLAVNALFSKLNSEGVSTTVVVDRTGSFITTPDAFDQEIHKGLNRLRGVTARRGETLIDDRDAPGQLPSFRV